MHNMVLLFAYLLDAIMGDPRWLPHPVVLVGRLIAFLERILRKRTDTSKGQLINGGIIAITVVVVVLGVSWLLINFSFKLHPYLGYLLTIFLLSLTLAARCLQEAAEAVYRPLQAGNIQEARTAVGMIVGRDTASMNEHGVARAAVETVAENTVDGVTAPLFYALIGGLPLALVYKAVNTMDSMLGYKNEKYLYFGRVAARLDDAANWLPARLTFPVMLLAAYLLRLDTASAYRAGRRDARKHPSPNSGWAEAAAAGALGVCLGGENHYGGQISRRPLLWEEGRQVRAADIGKSVRLMHVTAALFLLLGIALRTLLVFLWRKAGI